MRYNIFNNLQWQLRVALVNTCIPLSNMNEFDISFSDGIIKKIEGVLNLFKEQVKNETSYLLPLVFEYEPSIWDVYTRGHQKATNLASNIESHIQSYKKSKEASDKYVAIELIEKAYHEFMQFNFIHMDDEEEVLNEILWRYYKDDFIEQVEEQINGTPALFKQHKNVRRYQAANAA